MISLTGTRSRLRSLFIKTVKCGNKSYYFSYDERHGTPFATSLNNRDQDTLTLVFYLREEPDHSFEITPFEELKEQFPEWADELEIELLRGLL